jgi:hypothetical protein
MARHPDVKEKEIIEAAIVLEQKGRIPNPGAIRAQLGYRGGLVRIRQVWEQYQANKDGADKSARELDLTFDDLPSDISDSASHLISRQKVQLEALVVSSFYRCQTVFEKRIDDIILKHEKAIAYYTEYEESADVSIEKLELENTELNMELKDLAEQNAKLLIENAKLNGQLSAFEISFAKPA